MNKVELETLIEQGLTTWQIADVKEKSQTTVRYWLKKFNLKTKFAARQKKQHIPINHSCKYCNILCESGPKRAGHQLHCKLNPNRDNIRKKRSMSRKGVPLSEAHKKKISKSRIKYLKANPDKVPYLLNHSSSMSYPERLFASALEDEGMTGWVYGYQNSIYQYDFAWPDVKLDVEIDGSTHQLEHVKKIDEKRDKFSIENGWTVLRFTDYDIKNDIHNVLFKINYYI